MELSKYIGLQIKKLRESRRMDQQTFANKIGTSRVNVARYESGLRKANQDILFTIAEKFGVNIDYFFPEIKNAMSVDTNNFRDVPLVGFIACGTPILAEQNIDGYVPMYFSENYKNDVIFALRCKGNSMEPTLKSGDTAFIKRQSIVEDGEIAAVLVDDNEEATLKRIKHVDDQVLLIPDNTDGYAPIILNKNNPGRILGKLVEVRRKF